LSHVSTAIIQWSWSRDWGTWLSSVLTQGGWEHFVPSTSKM